MRIVRACSYRCADALTKQLNEKNEKRRIYYYSFQIILGGLLKFLVLIVLALLTGSFIKTFAVLAFYAGFRIAAGGYHMDDYTNCMIVSLAMFIGSGLIAKYTHMLLSKPGLLASSFIIFLVAVFTAIKFAPADTPFKPIRNEKRKKRLKNLSIAYLFVWLGADVFFIFKGFNLAVVAGCLGILIEAFSISPAGYAFFDFVSGGMKKIKRGSKIR